jgi:hypothetical protein
MREQASPGPLPRPRAGSAPLRVLLVTEGFPAVGGAGSGDGQLAEALVRALPEVEFVVSTLTPPEASDQGRRGGREAPRVAGRDAERAFIPLFHDLLGEITRGDFDPDRFAGLLSALRAHFQVWDYRATWRSRAVWDALRKRAVPAVEVLGEGSGDALIASRWSFPGEREGSLVHEAPTIGESAEAVRFLYRSLSPVTAELPVTDLSHAMSAGP